jgi:hypothetical protein
MSKNYYLFPESLDIIVMPTIFIIGVKRAGQEKILNIFSTMDMGGQMRRPHTLEEQERYFAVFGPQINEKWRELVDKHSDACFILSKPPLVDWIQHYRYEDRGQLAQEYHDYYTQAMEYLSEHDRRFIVVNPRGVHTGREIAEFIGLKEGVDNPHVETNLVDMMESATTFMGDAKRYYKARMKWKSAGQPMRSLALIRAIYDNDCSKCFAFDKTNSRCSICRCYIQRDTQELNKLAWGTEQCPLPDPKWIAISEIKDEDIVYDEEPPEEPEPEPPKLHKAKPQSRKCC